MEIDTPNLDRIRTELKDILRVETKTKALKKLPVGFYHRINETVAWLKRKSQETLSQNNLNEYVQLQGQLIDLERDFRSFFELRHGKIAALSVYDLDQESLSRLSQEEKAAYADHRALSEKHLKQQLEGEI